MRSEQLVPFVACLLSLVGCGSASLPTKLPYAAGQTSIIGGDFDNADGLAEQSLATPTANECIDLDSVCVKPQEQCGKNARADVLISADGQVADVICYPTSGVSVESFDGPVRNVGNDVVLVLDAVDDGADVLGDVTIDGNNVTLYGHGPENSVIEGNLTVAKNNSVVRGVRIDGDVTISKNNASLVDCVITGNLTITGNDMSLALCEVWGETKIEGNNTLLVSNKLAVLPVLKGKNTRCSQNIMFDDSNHDQALSDGELGSEWLCNETADKKK